MTGQVPDAGPYIEQMDILVNASDPEPFGIVLLEGMARGVPVVAVDSGGPAEFIEDGRTGVLARSGEPDALADALEPLLASPRAAARSVRPVASGSCGSSPTPRCASGSSRTSSACARAAGPHGLRGDDRRPRRRLGRRHGAPARRARARASPARPPGHGDRPHVRAAGRRRRALSPRARPAPPFLLAYPWFMLAGSLAVRQAAPRGRPGRPARSCWTASTSSRFTTATRSGPPTRAADAPYRVQVKAVGACSASPSGSACARAEPPRSCACLTAWPRRCASTSRGSPTAW